MRRDQRQKCKLSKKLVPKTKNVITLHPFQTNYFPNGIEFRNFFFVQNKPQILVPVHDFRPSLGKLWL